MRQMKKGIIYLVLLLMLLLTACSNSANPAGTEANGESVVNIGYSGPLSGPAAYYGKNSLSGLEMAAEEINADGGFEVDGKKYTVNLVSLDDKYLPNETGSNAKRLKQEHHTPIVYVPHSGGILATQVFNTQDPFIIGAYTSEPAIVEQGNPLTVQIPPKYDGYIEPFSKYQMEHFGKKIALLPTSTQYGKDWTKALVPVWEKLGGEVVYESSIDFNKDTDFFTIVTNALKKNPDVLFVGGPSEPTALVMKQARELGFKGGFIVMDQAKMDEIEAVLGGPEALEGAVGVLPLVNTDFPGTKTFIEKYNQEHKKNPGSEAGYHYLSLYIFVEAMKAAKSVDDPQKIMEHLQDGLENMPDAKKVYEIEKIGKDGSLEMPYRIAAVKDGKVVEIPVK